MQHRIKQRRMHTKTLTTSTLRQHHLGIHNLTNPPRRTQPLEQRPILITRRRHPRIERINRHHLSTSRRPLPSNERAGSTSPVNQPAHDKQPNPPPLRPRIHPNLTTTITVPHTHHHLHLPRNILLQNQRSLQHQLLHNRGADLRSCGQGQFDEGGARQEHGAEYGMILCPRLGILRYAPGEQPLVPLAHLHHCGQQGA
ncbi:hypothetical protein NKH18_14790 [Streptomyces sp. M10(2022)]